MVNWELFQIKSRIWNSSYRGDFYYFVGPRDLNSYQLKKAQKIKIINIDFYDWIVDHVTKGKDRLDYFFSKPNCIIHIGSSIKRYSLFGKLKSGWVWIGLFAARKFDIVYWIPAYYTWFRNKTASICLTRLCTN